MFGRIAIPLISSATVIGLWTGAIKIGSAHLAPQKNQVYAHSTLETATEGIKISQVGNGVAPQLTTDKHAVTVIGQGQAAAPADKALLEFRLGSREPAEQPLGVTVPAAPQEELSIKAALKPVVDALVAIKVPAENIEVQTSSVENPKLLVRFSKPTREQMQQVVAAASNAIQKSNMLFLQGIGAEYGVNDCQPLEREARRLAISDAQVEVTSVALQLGVKVGEMLFVTVYPSFGPSNISACGSKAAVPASPFSLTSDTPPYNPSAPVEVQVRSQVSITYTIK